MKMKIKRLITRVNQRYMMHRMAAVLAIALSLGAFTTAFGQLDPGALEILQNGRVVGVIYVPVRSQGQTLYSEHWILFDTYLYPGSTNDVNTEIVPSLDKRYASESDFFAPAPWGRGFRYVHAISNDTSTLPGR